jgi:hypothetical protein
LYAHHCHDIDKTLTPLCLEFGKRLRPRLGLPAFIHRQIVNQRSARCQFVGQQFASACATDNADPLTGDIAEGILGKQVFAVKAAGRLDVDDASRGSYSIRRRRADDSNQASVSVLDAILDGVAAYKNDDIGSFKRRCFPVDTILV